MRIGTFNQSLYNNGRKYSLALKEKRFSNLTLIPDITFYTLINSLDIGLLMVGVNGFDKENFRYSAGHGPILFPYNVNYWPKVILIVLSQKFSEKVKIEKQVLNDYALNEINQQLKFWSGNTRTHIWFSNTKEMIEDLISNDIKILNPREDIIKINTLDYFISDAGWFAIKDKEDINQTKTNKDNFIEATKNY